MNLKNYECDGQLSIFDLFNQEIPTAPVDTDIINPETLNYISGKAWTYVRECDNRTMKQWYLIADNGLVYAKIFMTFRFILKFKNYAEAVKGAEKFFAEEMECNQLPKNAIEVDPFSVVDYEPMHKCIESCDWDFTEKSCSYVSPYRYS